MFTGIIKELGKISQIKAVKDSQQLTIQAKDVLKDIHLGDSIAINGTCLTVTTFNDTEFTVDVMPETYNCTSLSTLQINSLVNLEAAIAIGERLGGHFVTGHVDGVGEIIKINQNNNAMNYQIKLPAELLKYCLIKGSIAVDGTSLTVFALGDDFVGLSLIPHTLKNSVLGRKKVGDIVNIECDMLGKYVVNLLQQPGSIESMANVNSRINKEFLQDEGFI